MEEELLLSLSLVNRVITAVIILVSCCFAGYCLLFELALGIVLVEVGLVAFLLVGIVGAHLLELEVCCVDLV
jgi:hypothetical protein